MLKQNIKWTLDAWGENVFDPIPCHSLCGVVPSRSFTATSVVAMDTKSNFVLLDTSC